MHRLDLRSLPWFGYRPFSSSKSLWCLMTTEALKVDWVFCNKPTLLHTEKWTIHVLLDNLQVPAKATSMLLVLRHPKNISSLLRIYCFCHILTHFLKRRYLKYFNDWFTWLYSNVLGSDMLTIPSHWVHQPFWIPFVLQILSVLGGSLC